MTGEQLTSLYDQHGEGLVGYAAALLSNSAEAEDVVHDAFAKLWSRAQWGFIPSSPENYLFRAVRNAAYSRLRRRLLFARRRRDCTWLEPRQPGESGGASREAICDALTRLPAKQREVITLKVFSDMTFNQIGQLLQLSPATAASRYRYALEKLRLLLNEEDVR